MSFKDVLPVSWNSLYSSLLSTINVSKAFLYKYTFIRPASYTA